MWTYWTPRPYIFWWNCICGTFIATFEGDEKTPKKPRLKNAHLLRLLVLCKWQFRWFTLNRTKLPFLKSKLNRGKTLAKSYCWVLRAVAHTARPGASPWLDLEPSLGKGTTLTSLPFGQLCGHKQSRGTAGLRSRNFSLTFAFTNSCCFCRARLSSAMGCVSWKEQ